MRGIGEGIRAGMICALIVALGYLLWREIWL